MVLELAEFLYTFLTQKPIIILHHNLLQSNISQILIVDGWVWSRSQQVTSRLPHSKFGSGCQAILG